MAQQPQPEIETDLKPGEFAIALVAAATFFFGGWLGLIPSIWFLYVITNARLTVDHRRMLIAPIRAARALPDKMRAIPGSIQAIPERLRAAITDNAPTLEIAPAAPEAVHNPTGASFQHQPDRRPVAVAERPRWLSAVNDEPDRAPHTLIIGPTGAGKTTMACAALGDRPDRTVVISPKVNGGNWRGAEVITLDDDGTYEPIHQTLLDLEQEKRDRIVTLRKRGADALKPMTIVLDETPELVRFVPKAGDFIGSMSSIGRELKMRLVVISTSSRVKDLGIEGRGAALENFIRVDLDRDRRATIDDGIRKMALPTKEVQARAKGARLRPWRGEELPETVTHAEQLPLPTPRPATQTTTNLALPPDDLLASLLATMSPERAARLQSVTVERAGGDVTVNVQQVAPTMTRSVKRREGAVNVKDRARRLRRKAYYEQAARENVSFTRAYADAPEGEKGNYNEAGQWYRAEKAKTAP